MYNLFTLISVFHNAETNEATWLTTSGASITPFRAVGSVKDCSADSAVLHAVLGGLDSLAKQFAGRFVPREKLQVHVLVPTNQWADRLNALDGKPLLGADTELLGAVIRYKKNASITFHADMSSVPVDSTLAKVFAGWKHGWQ